MRCTGQPWRDNKLRKTDCQRAGKSVGAISAINAAASISRSNLP